MVIAESATLKVGQMPMLMKSVTPPSADWARSTRFPIVPPRIRPKQNLLSLVFSQGIRRKKMIGERIRITVITAEITVKMDKYPRKMPNAAPGLGGMRIMLKKPNLKRVSPIARFALIHNLVTWSNTRTIKAVK